jgi:pilus assembly protein CpaE
MDKAHILVVEDSEITLFKLKAILIRLGYTVTTSADPLAALQWLQKSGTLPDLIISDVVMPGINGYDFIRQVKSLRATARIPVILLTAQTEIGDRVAGFEAGADDYLGKSVSPTELELRIKALLSRSQADSGGAFTQSTAKTISVFSLRGGVGTTSIAINLSIALAQLWEIRVCLWDLAVSSGHCAFFLNMKPRGSIAAFADWPEPTVDDQVLSDLLARHESGIHLMPAPPSPEEAELVTAHTVDLLLPFMLSNFAYLVVDAGNHFTEPALTLFERSDIILLTLAPELASVKSAIDVLHIFDKLGIATDKVFPVVSCNFQANRVPSKRIETALSKKILAEFPFDSDGFIQAIHSGRPFITTDPKSEISLTAAALAYRLSMTEMETAKKAHSNPFLDGIRKFVKGS